MFTLEAAKQELVFIVLLCRVSSVAMLIPFFGWGVYTLRAKYRFHHDLSPFAEACTLAGLVIYYAFEISLIRAGTRHEPTLFVLATLGLFAAGAALYGPMFLSLASQVLADQIAPTRRSHTHEPHYGVAEGCERVADYEGAVRAYKSIAQMFPKNPIALVHVADNLIKLSRHEEAVDWFERSLELLNDPEVNLGITNRLAEIYINRINEPEKAMDVLEEYLERFTDSPYAPFVRERLMGLRNPKP